MIAHVVLFSPRSDLTAEARHDLAATFERAVREIASIRRARVGRRLTHGRGYEALMKVDYSYAAVLEFDSVADLLAYLQHPAHDQLAARFFESFEHALMYDFDLVEDPVGVRSLLES